jgi:hypothetical protein
LTFESERAFAMAMISEQPSCELWLHALRRARPPAGDALFADKTHLGIVHRFGEGDPDAEGEGSAFSDADGSSSNVYSARRQSFRPATLGGKRNMPSTLTTRAGNHAIEGSAERRQVLFDDKPDGPDIYPEVPVHDHVAKAGQLTPRYLRLGGFEAIGQALARACVRAELGRCQALASQLNCIGEHAAT